MYAAATCTGTILRGDALDEYHDRVDNSTVAASGVLARIESRGIRVVDQTTQTPNTVRTPYARMQSDTDIRPGDRYRDDTHGITYVVLDVDQPNQLGRESDLNVGLQRVTAAE